MMRRSFASPGVLSIALCLLLSSCGYHLMGMGRGVVPADADTVRMVAAGSDDAFKSALLGFLRDNADYKVVPAASEEAANVELHVSELKETSAPITYDASGIASVERMRLTGHISLWREHEQLWQSGDIVAYEDVDVAGDPTAIESAKARIRSDLQTQWMRQAWLKLSSGF